jgi:anti-sigma B factor antagonist
MSKLILTLLQSNDATEQKRGIELAVKSDAYSVLPQMLKLISSGDTSVKEQANLASISLAKTCLKSKSPFLSQAIISLAVQTIRSLAPEYVQTLHKWLHSLDVAKTIEALMLLKYFIREKEAEEILTNTLKSPSNKIRATAVLHIGLIASKNNAEVLSKFLEDSDNRVKANTIEVFERMKNKVFIRILNRFRNDPNNRIRGNALKALHAMGETNIKEDLQHMLMEPKALMRASAVWTLGEIGRTSPSYLKLMNMVKNDPDELVRHNLMLVLKKVGNIPEADFLRVALKADLQKQLKEKIINKKDLKIEELPQNAYYELKLRGVITASTVLVLKLLLDELVEKDSRFIFDLSKVEYIDSSGIGLMINFRKGLHKKNGFLYLFGCTYRVSELIQLSGIDKILNIFNSKEEIHEFLVIPEEDRKY